MNPLVLLGLVMIVPAFALPWVVQVIDKMSHNNTRVPMPHGSVVAFAGGKVQFVEYVDRNR